MLYVDASCPQLCLSKFCVFSAGRCSHSHQCLLTVLVLASESARPPIHLSRNEVHRAPRQIHSSYPFLAARRTRRAWTSLAHSVTPAASPPESSIELCMRSATPELRLRIPCPRGGIFAPNSVTPLGVGVGVGVEWEMGVGVRVAEGGRWCTVPGVGSRGLMSIVDSCTRVQFNRDVVVRHG
ncbi:hypothetical protein L226DRAFT_275601 [Lentinus tigrinus ALCF2SS1-7]|uniref:Uncharacterized protein n=1 Tax=Lentinus tigrinus ALCF2SS1-6 TaxID=1328759 RepID=A0A5C2SCP3_9APHY|nr:hypothetical protein L227DRAFT_70750 [Lentinus tigrinus ALCF2SS1-6]RPD69477.1 hypothetical protein L226DRAFT_275601 [Lentinus tigrinus ALCF2SS1-7]